MPELSAYATALAYGRGRPAHVKSKADGDRVTAYWTYGEIYKNVADVFAAVMRDPDGEEAYTRYIPSGRLIVDSTNRYLAQDMAWVPGAQQMPSITPEVFAEQIGFLQTLFDREEFYVKFLSMKKNGFLAKGDGLLHITVDESKEPGTRLSINEIDPSTYFTIPDPLRPDRVKGCYIVDVILDDEKKEITQRLEYQRIMTEEDAAASGAPIGTVWTRLGFYEIDGWDDRAHVGFTAEDLKPVAPPSRFGGEELALLTEGFPFPPAITALPVYHFRNNRNGSEPFGLSEMQGIETLIAGINQTATDEDLAVALNGLGMYASDGGPPTDPVTGQSTDWVIAPGSVAETQSGAKFWRVDGISTVQPSLDHLNMLSEQARETTATPDVAVGRVDVQLAESGVALALQFRPVTSKNAEKEIELAGKTQQMIWDIQHGWFPAYEGLQPVEGLIVAVEFGDPIPVNRKETVDEVLAMATSVPPLISMEFARTLLAAKLGIAFPSDMLAQIVAEQGAMLDADAVRLGTDASAESAGVAVEPPLL